MKTDSRKHVKTRSLTLERRDRELRMMNDDGEVEALRSLVSLLWITQQHSLACFKQEEQTNCKLMFTSFSNGNGSGFENSLDSGSGYPFESLPARCTKTPLLEAW